MDPESFNSLLKLAAANGNKCDYDNDFDELLCNCTKKDCSDFPTIHFKVESGG